MKRFITIAVVSVVVVIMVGAGYWVARRYVPIQSNQDTDSIMADDDNYADSIVVTNPEAGGIISSPVEIIGEARGSWYFEASFPVVIQDDNGMIIAQHYATAQDDWMSEEFVPFQSRLVFDPSQATTDTGVIVLKKDNPSGLPEHDAQITIPIRFR